MENTKCARIALPIAAGLLLWSAAAAGDGGPFVAPDKPPVAVNVGPDSALPTKKRRKTLPGVGHYVVNERLTRGSVVRTNGDGTEIVMISGKFPNRIATPFEHPRLIDQSHVEYQIDGSSIYLAAKTSDPVSIFITGTEATDPVVSLTLIPKPDVPSQTITLQVDSAQGAVRKAARAATHDEDIVALLRTVAKGKTPEGYAEGAMPNIVAKHDEQGLMIIPVTRYSGSTLDIYKYRVVDNQADIELSETSFYQKGVRGVAIYPNLILHKNQSTYVFVLADKSVLEEGGNE